MNANYINLRSHLNNALPLSLNHPLVIEHQQNPTYAPMTLYDALKDTIKTKGRPLYYYPLLENNGTKSENYWIG